MVINKRKKNSRHRGSWSHGYGSRKKHRGAGSRGGRGRAGTGKRADQKKPSYWRKRYFGKQGFKKKGIRKEVRSINIFELENAINSEKLKSADLIDLDKMGYDKLLGKGNISSKLKITVKEASKKALEKIKKKGGEVVIKGS